MDFEKHLVHILMEHLAVKETFPLKKLMMGWSGGGMVPVNLMEHKIELK